MTVEPKIDGLAISLIYRDGLLVKGLTRGDGFIGEDVTHNIKTIRNIPLKLKNSMKGEIEVRGEVFMPTDSFEKLNKQKIKDQKKLESLAQLDKKEMTPEQLKELKELGDSYVFNSTSWGYDVVSPRRDTEEFNKICEDILEYNKDYNAK